MLLALVWILVVFLGAIAMLTVPVVYIVMLGATIGPEQVASRWLDDVPLALVGAFAVMSAIAYVSFGPAEGRARSEG